MDIKQALVIAILLLCNPTNSLANDFNATASGDNFELMLLQNTPANWAWLESLGDNVHVQILQKGDPSYLDLATYGDDNVSVVIQENGSQAATIQLYNNGGPVDFTADQQSLNGSTYDLLSYCVNSNGCTITILQQ
jgi:hypothetical protein